jgi:tetratricopeptide (TPR) repeat protein
MSTYDAFISYSHAKDKAVAAALQAVKQKLGKPWYRRRALRIFRDDTSLAATPQLWSSIEAALSQSRYLVLLASPEAAASRWVCKEVGYWLEHKSVDTVLVALTDGVLIWDDAVGDFAWSEHSPLPPVLRRSFSGEPKWVDLRAYRNSASPRDRKFIELGADLAAAIHGVPKEDLLSQEVRQQRRALTLAWSAVGVLLVLFAAAVWEWKDALTQRDRAETALIQADRNYSAATNVSSGVVDIVRDLISAGTISTKLAEPLLEVTRKTILQLEDEKENDSLRALEWQLLNTLSLAYIDVPGQAANALELARKMRDLAERLAANRPDNDSYRQLLINSEIRIGDALEARGLFDEALQSYRTGQVLMAKLAGKDRTNGDRKRMLVYIQRRIGDTLRKKDDRLEAAVEFKANLVLVEELAANPAAKPDWIRARALAHQRMGDILREGGHLDQAIEHFQAYHDAIATLIKLERPNVPNLTWRLDLAISKQRIGDVLLELKDYPRALEEYREYQKGASDAANRDPEQGEWQRFLANSHLKIGDALLAQGTAAEAAVEYATALQVYAQLAAKDLRPRSQRNLAIAHQRLGTARLATSDFAGAVAEFRACLSLAVDESARDAQITSPVLVHEDCRSQLAQIKDALMFAGAR